MDYTFRTSNLTNFEQLAWNECVNKEDLKTPIQLQNMFIVCAFSAFLVGLLILSQEHNWNTYPQRFIAIMYFCEAIQSYNTVFIRMNICNKWEKPIHFFLRSIGQDDPDTGSISFLQVAGTISIFMQLQ